MDSLQHKVYCFNLNCDLSSRISFALVYISQVFLFAQSFIERRAVLATPGSRPGLAVLVLCIQRFEE